MKKYRKIEIGSEFTVPYIKELLTDLLMKNYYLILLTFLLSFGSLQAQGPITLDPIALQARLDSIYNAPGEGWVAGIVASVRYEEQHWEGSTGWAYIDSLPMTEDYHFRYYSATKSVTAAAVLEQVVQGNMDLDDHLGKYLTTITNPNIDTTVTLRQLPRTRRASRTIPTMTTWLSR